MVTIYNLGQESEGISDSPQQNSGKIDIKNDVVLTGLIILCFYHHPLDNFLTVKKVFDFLRNKFIITEERIEYAMINLSNTSLITYSFIEDDIQSARRFHWSIRMDTNGGHPHHFTDIWSNET